MGREVWDPFDVFVKIKYLFSTALEMDLKRWRSCEHRMLLSVTSDAGLSLTCTGPFCTMSHGALARPTL
jgi:hypothetical protein